MGGLLDTLSVLAQGAGGFGQGLDRRERERVAKEERGRVLKLQEEEAEQRKINQMILRAQGRQQIELQIARNKAQEDFQNAQAHLAQQRFEATREDRNKLDTAKLEIQNKQLTNDVYRILVGAYQQNKTLVLNNIDKVQAYKAMIKQFPEARDPVIDAFLSQGDVFLPSELRTPLLKAADIKEPTVTEKDGDTLGAVMTQAGVTPEEELRMEKLPSTLDTGAANLADPGITGQPRQEMFGPGAGVQPVGRALGFLGGLARPSGPGVPPTPQQQALTNIFRPRAFAEEEGPFGPTSRFGLPPLGP